MLYKRDDEGKMQAWINKKEYLQGMLGRLENEAGTALDAYKTASEKSKRNIGFWGMIRLLMPVVESFGMVKHPDLHDSWDYATEVLKSLNVPYPRIAWRLFRDCLIHGDEMLNVIEDDKELYSGWEISIGGGHVQRKLNPHIDTEQLYEDLYKSIEKEIDIIPENEELCLRAIRFKKEKVEADKELKEELEELF